MMHRAPSRQQHHCAIMRCVSDNLYLARQLRTRRRCSPKCQAAWWSAPLALSLSGSLSRNSIIMKVALAKHNFARLMVLRETLVVHSARFGVWIGPAESISFNVVRINFWRLIDTIPLRRHALTKILCLYPLMNRITLSHQGQKYWNIKSSKNCFAENISSKKMSLFPCVLVPPDFVLLH